MSLDRGWISTVCELKGKLDKLWANILLLRLVWSSVFVTYAVNVQANYLSTPNVSPHPVSYHFLSPPPSPGDNIIQRFPNPKRYPKFYRCLSAAFTKCCRNHEGKNTNAVTVNSECMEREANRCLFECLTWRISLHSELYNIFDKSSWWTRYKRNLTLFFW